MSPTLRASWGQGGGENRRDVGTQAGQRTLPAPPLTLLPFPPLQGTMVVSGANDVPGVVVGICGGQTEVQRPVGSWGRACLQPHQVP